MSELRPSQIETLKALADCEPPGITAYRLHRVLGISRSAAHARLRCLEQSGHLAEPGWTRYFDLTDQGREALAGARD